MIGSAIDWFVGCVGVALGVLSLWAGVRNWEAAYQAKRVQWVDRRFGRTGARWFLIVLGVLLIALGIAVTLGFAPNASEKPGYTLMNTPG